MHSRDTTVLIDLLLRTTPACFSTFFDLLWSLKIPNFLVYKHRSVGLLLKHKYLLVENFVYEFP